MNGFYRLVAVIAATSLLAACVSTYEVQDQAEAAKITIRSPQGYLVHAFTFDEPENCAGRKALRSKSGKKAVKTFSVDTSKEIAISMNVIEPDVLGNNCEFTVKFNPKPGKHYLINSIIDVGKQRCNNRLVSYPENNAVAGATFVKHGLGARLSNASAWCKNFNAHKIAADDGRFTTMIYEKDAGYQYSTKEAKNER